MWWNIVPLTTVPSDEEELALEPVRERSPDRRLPRARWTREQDPTLRLEVELFGRLRVLEREHDVCLERLEDVVEALEIAQIDLLHLLQIDIARHVMLSQIGDESFRIERGALA